MTFQKRLGDGPSRAGTPEHRDHHQRVPNAPTIRVRRTPDSTPTIDHDSVEALTGALDGPAPRRYTPSANLSFRRFERVCSVKARGPAVSEAAVELGSSVGQRGCRRRRFLCHAAAQWRGMRLIRRRGAFDGEPRRVGAAPWPAARAKRTCGDPQCRARKCGRKLSRQRSAGIRRRVGRHASKPVQRATEGSSVQLLAAGGREKDGLCGSPQ